MEIKKPGKRAGREREKGSEWSNKRERRDRKAEHHRSFQLSAPVPHKRLGPFVDCEIMQKESKGKTSPRKCSWLISSLRCSSVARMLTRVRMYSTSVLHETTGNPPSTRLQSGRVDSVASRMPSVSGTPCSATEHRKYAVH